MSDISGQARIRKLESMTLAILFWREQEIWTTGKGAMHVWPAASQKKGVPTSILNVEII